ncbi:MAG: DUF1573 domain-containing protein [Chlamydiota bacterium]|nr:DUF1573 domain-containing protein [Chlamydiota bacterium]
MATLDMVSQTNAAKTPEEYYKMFKCSCCGKPIDTDCCETSRQRKAHLDKVLLEEKDDNAVVLKMVKKFGYEVLMDRSKEQEVKAYAKRAAAKDSPKIVIENPRHNFGTIRQVDGVVVTAFNIKNKGRSDLVITELDTSCGCTSASLVYRGQKSPAFSMSMHGKNPKDFKLKIPPGDTAILEVSYDPNAHGKQEKPEIKTIREVYIMSNDPVDFYQKVKVELVQIP